MHTRPLRVDKPPGQNPPCLGHASGEEDEVDEDEVLFNPCHAEFDAAADMWAGLKLGAP